MRIVDDEALSRFRGPGRCEYCGQMVSNREPHHLQARGIGSGSRLDITENLMALCATFAGGENCHDKAHWGAIPRAELLEIVARRERKTVQAIQAKVWRLLRKPKK